MTQRATTRDESHGEALMVCSVQCCLAACTDKCALSLSGRDTHALAVPAQRAHSYMHCRSPGALLTRCVYSLSIRVPTTPCVTTKCSRVRVTLGERSRHNSNPTTFSRHNSAVRRWRAHIGIAARTAGVRHALAACFRRAPIPCSADAARCHKRAVLHTLHADPATHAHTHRFVRRRPRPCCAQIRTLITDNGSSR